MHTRTVFTTKTVAEHDTLRTALRQAGVDSYSYITAKGGTPSKSSVTAASTATVDDVAKAAGVKVVVEIGTFDAKWRRLT